MLEAKRMILLREKLMAEVLVDVKILQKRKVLQIVFLCGIPMILEIVKVSRSLHLAQVLHLRNLRQRLRRHLRQRQNLVLQLLEQ